MLRQELRCSCLDVFYSSIFIFGVSMDSIGIYVHIPFCDCKCAYCDFFSISNKSEYDKYVREVNKRIDMFSDIYKYKVDTIYFGGGTPSVLETDRLCAILRNIKYRFVVSDLCEVTVEVNPCSAENIDFRVLRRTGFNRISIGMQSAIDSELKILSRRHTAQKARETVENARLGGFDNISLDLMLCIPNQTKNSLTESIKFCKDCNVEHISAYILKIEEGTHFYKIKDNLNLFDDDEQAKMYLHAVNELEKYGYHQYEISNFSKVGFEGKHNLKYWRDEEYLGVGPSAHSFVDGKRFYYDRSFEKFYNNEIIYDGCGGDIEEYIMLKLRLKEGLSLAVLSQKYGFNPTPAFYNRINQLKNQGLLEHKEDIINLTKEGFLLSNSIINYILDVI